MTLIDQEDRSEAGRGATLLAIGFGIYAAIVIALSGTGVYSAVSTNFFPATILIANLGLITAYFCIPSIRALAAAIGPYALSYFHVWRVPAGTAFIYYGSQGLLPEIFVDRAGYGDIIAGTLAAILFFLPRRLIYVTAFNIFGLADIVMAVGTGVFLNATAPESMLEIVKLPISLIPLIGVPLAVLAHVAAFDLLIKGRRGTP